MCIYIYIYIYIYTHTYVSYIVVSCLQDQLQRCPGCNHPGCDHLSVGTDEHYPRDPDPETVSF